MAILVDSPVWPFRGRRWAHLISDVSLAELHAFARVLGLPERAFHEDHYDLPAERHTEAVDLGATAVTGRDVVAALRRSGLRRSAISRSDPHQPPAPAA